MGDTLRRAPDLIAQNQPTVKADRKSAVLWLFGLLFAGNNAHGHEAFSGWIYPDDCCGDMDCRQVACGEISPVAGGWQWRRVVFSRTMLRRSPDGGCHVCVGNPDMKAVPHCIYLPPET